MVIVKVKGYYSQMLLGIVGGHAGAESTAAKLEGIMRIDKNVAIVGAIGRALEVDRGNVAFTVVDAVVGDRALNGAMDLVVDGLN